jgi:DNA-binding protein HU-beta
MIKSDIVEGVAVMTGVDKTKVKKVVDAMIKMMRNNLVSHEEFQLRGFGSFKVVTRKAKTARAISIGTSIMVPEHAVVKFVPSDDFATEVGCFENPEYEKFKKEV